MKRILLTTILTALTFVGMQAQRIVERHAFQGTLDGKTTVRLAFEVNGDDIVAGHIYYPKAAHPAPIMIVGFRHDTNDYHLNEYQANGEITGLIDFTISKGRLSGTWTNPRTEKELKFTQMNSIAFPKGFGGLLIPEDPGKLGHEYSFDLYHTGIKELMGGSVRLKAAGKNKVHFDICNVSSGNIAEGESETGRPAVLKGNKFVYKDVNDCGYAFSATFFPRFVVLQTVSSWDTTECFGAHSSFGGVSIKIKD